MSESIWTHVKKPWLSHELPISLVRFGHLFLPHCHSCHIIMACLIIACLIMTHWHLIMLALETPSCSRLVLIPLNKPFPLEKSKRILKVLNIIGFITPYSRMMQALYHLGQGNNLPSQLLNLIFLRLMLLVIILFYLRRKTCTMFGIYSVPLSSIPSSSYPLCHKNQ